MKKFMIGLLASAVLFVTPALAEKVYDVEYGQWRLQGVAGEGDDACVFSTYWNDGTQINVNVFPKINDAGEYDPYITMTVYNPEVDFIAKRGGSSASVTFINDGVATTHEGIFQPYGPNKVIARSLNEIFADGFIYAETMILFPGQFGELAVPLTGTKVLVESYLPHCVDRVFEYGDH